MAHFWNIGIAKHKEPLSPWRTRLHEIIFEADTRAGKIFDVLLILSIVLSVGVVLLDSITAVHQRYSDLLYKVEWIFTVFFTVEYALRLLCVGRPLVYATSFFGIIDLLAIAPTYLSLLLPGTHYLLVIRLLRVLRVFRVLKLVQYVGEVDHLVRALQASRRKIIVFVFTVLTLVVLVGSFMYVIEGAENGFTSIPQGMYWAVVTLTTVGYGDVSPQTPIGKTLAAFIMILGYGIIAVPTGIVTAELTMAGSSRNTNTRSCHDCSADGHDDDAIFCKYCGESLQHHT